MRNALTAALGLAFVFVSGSSFADEPAYRGVAHAPGFDENFAFDSIYVRGARIEITTADSTNHRMLRVIGCGGRTAEYSFEAPGRLFVAFENSESRQRDHDCDIYLDLYFTQSRGLADHIVADHVVIWRSNGRFEVLPG